jgi:hypothetical protein
MRCHLEVSTFALAAALALVAFVTGGAPLSGLANQRVTSDAQAVHPIVGTWQWANNPGDEGTPFAGTSFAVFHADGTYVEFFPPVGVGIGTWQVTGANTADVTIVFQDIDEDPYVFEPGISTYRISIVVDSSGNVLTATGDLEVRDASDAVVLAMPFTGFANRMTVAGPSIPGTPVATPVT